MLTRDSCSWGTWNRSYVSAGLLVLLSATSTAGTRLFAGVLWRFQMVCVLDMDSSMTSLPQKDKIG